MRSCFSSSICNAPLFESGHLCASYCAGCMHAQFVWDGGTRRGLHAANTTVHTLRIDRPACRQAKVARLVGGSKAVHRLTHGQAQLQLCELTLTKTV